MSFLQKLSNQESSSQESVLLGRRCPGYVLTLFFSAGWAKCAEVSEVAYRSAGELEWSSKKEE